MNAKPILYILTIMLQQLFLIHEASNQSIYHFAIIKAKEKEAVKSKTVYLAVLIRVYYHILEIEGSYQAANFTGLEHYLLECKQLSEDMSDPVKQIKDDLLSGNPFADNFKLIAGSYKPNEKGFSTNYGNTVLMVLHNKKGDQFVPAPSVESLIKQTLVNEQTFEFILLQKALTTISSSSRKKWQNGQKVESKVYLNRQDASKAVLDFAKTKSIKYKITFEKINHKTREGKVYSAYHPSQLNLLLDPTIVKHQQHELSVDNSVSALFSLFKHTEQIYKQLQRQRTLFTQVYTGVAFQALFGFEEILRSPNQTENTKQINQALNTFFIAGEQSEKSLHVCLDEEEETDNHLIWSANQSFEAVYQTESKQPGLYPDLNAEFSSESVTEPDPQNDTKNPNSETLAKETLHAEEPLNTADKEPEEESLTEETENEKDSDKEEENRTSETEDKEMADSAVWENKDPREREEEKESDIKWYIIGFAILLTVGIMGIGAGMMVCKAKSMDSYYAERFGNNGKRNFESGVIEEPNTVIEIKNEN